MIRRGTWGVLAALAALAGLAYFLGQRTADLGLSATPTESMPLLFGETPISISRLRVESAAGEAVELARNQDGSWVLNAPDAQAADAAAAEAASSQVGALRVLARVDVAAALVGLDRPEYVITTESELSGVHILKVGSMTPINDGYYVALDGGQVSVVDKFGLDELIGLVEAPPYSETPTPEGAGSAPDLSTATPGIGGTAESSPVAATASARP